MNNSRREFLECLGCAGVGVFALPIFFTEPIAAAGTERRYPIPMSDSVNIDRSSQLILVRSSNRVYVFSLSCPHENNAVKWVPKDRRFQCTKHDSQYQPDGVHTAGRATRNMDRYVIQRDGEAIVVDLHRWVRSDKDPAAWAAAVIQL